MNTGCSNPRRKRAIRNCSCRARPRRKFLQKLDLPFIPPELREDHGEFAAAEKNELPKLIEWTDLKGSLHNHSNWSDGHNTLEEIAEYMEESRPGVLGDHRSLQVLVSGQRAGCKTAARANQGNQKNQRSGCRAGQRFSAVDRQRKWIF